jgi:hypothetical protein
MDCLAVTAAVCAAGMIFTAAPPGTAATGRQITTYTDTFHVKLTGTSSEKGYYLSTDYHCRDHGSSAGFLHGDR